MSTDSPEPSDPRVGQVLDGRYRIIEHLSEGAMGVVYLAERLKLRRRVAIKFLRAGYAMDDRLRSRFEREARAMSQLEHPHVVSVIDFGLAEGAPYIVMERVVGTDLQEVLERGPVSVPRAVHIARQMLAGLAHAHGQGVIHRDIKPGNVMLTDATGTGDYVRLLDFGLAKLANKAPGDISTANIVVGTPNYMSPEQSLGDEIDERTDVYSTGIVLYELLTGIKPFEDDDTFEILRKHREESLPKLRVVAPKLDVPEGLEAVLRKALAKKPRNRYGSAIEFADALKAVMDDEAARAPTVMADSPLSQTMAVALPGSNLRLLLAAIVAAGIGVGGWYLWQNFGANSAPRTGDVAGSAEIPAPEPVAVATADTDAESGVIEDAGAPDAAVPDAAVPDAMVPDAMAADAATGDAGPPDAAAAPDATAAAPAAKPTPITWEGAKTLIKAGKREEAISLLRKLKRRNPKSALIPYALGNLYFEKNWWVKGIESYDLAIRNNRSYRSKRKIINNAIKALASSKSNTRRKVYALFLDRIGRSGYSALKRASKDKNKNIRSHASWLLKRMKRRR